MTGAEFKQARNERLGVSQGTLAKMIHTPKRTIQDWETAERVPGVAAMVMTLLLQRDRWVLEGIKAKVAKDIDAAGMIVSEPDPAFSDEEEEAHG
jgi:DNA-binding XRE family transcriptional regulator